MIYVLQDEMEAFQKMDTYKELGRTNIYSHQVDSNSPIYAGKRSHSMFTHVTNRGKTAMFVKVL